MSKRIARSFERIGKLIEASGLAAGDQQRAANWLRPLPPLCASFCQSYETRDVEKIHRLEQGLLSWLADPAHPSLQAGTLARALAAQLKNLHVQLGLPQLKSALTGPAPRGRG